VWSLVFPVVLAATPAGTASRCMQGCQALSDPSLRARACAACVPAGDRAAWVRQLGRLGPSQAEPRSADGVKTAELDRALDEALAQPDWQVQSAALEVRARLRGTSELVELTRYILAGPEPAAVLAVHRSGARGETAAQLAASLGRLGPAGARAREVLRVHGGQARTSLELEIYDADRGIQREALQHLAAYLGATPVSVVLAAMRPRPEVGDVIAVQALDSLLAGGSTPLGLAVTREASPSNQPLVNRLLAVFAARIDAARPHLKSTSVQERLGAAAQLGPLAPLSSPELLQLVQDPDARIRRGAARWLALGQERTVSELAAENVRHGEAPGADTWMKVLAESGEKGCGETASRLADDPALGLALRGTALEALGRCDGPAAWPRIRAGLADAQPAIRRGAVAALTWMPFQPAARSAVEAALADAEPEVAAAAARAAGVPGQQRLIPVLSRMLSHPSPRVRAAAAEGLGGIGAPDAAMVLAARLKQEPDPSVRRAWVDALGVLGCPAALAALQECAAADNDPEVRAAAEHALRGASR
jgi:HEAT repeat protein